MPAAWWAAVDTSDATKIRAYKGDGTRLAIDVFAPDLAGNGGWARVLWSGTLASTGEQKLKLEAPVQANASVAAGDTYGQYNAYDSSSRAYFPINEGVGDQIEDRSRTGRVGTASNTDWTTGKNGLALNFDINKDVNRVADLFISNVYSISMWLKFNNLVAFQDILACYINNSDGATIGISNVNSKLWGGNWTGQAISADFSVSTTGFYHVTLTSTGSVTQFYINGVASGTPGTTSFSTFSELTWLGERDGGSQDFDGTISDLMVATEARSAAWIAEEYAQSNDQSTFWGTWA
jgi:hypothetical protein